ncbi:MAG: FAD binding domain-containing protein [Planctomycetota bacterium]|jgi:carbon-monoxide dehydrogenase medium subunit
MVAKIDYYRPRSLSEALTLLGEYGKDMKILAGGTNLVVNIKEKTTQPKAIMDIKDLVELSGLSINDSGQGIIGPLATMSSTSHWCKSHGRYDNLRSASQQLGSYQIRNRATVGGNLCDGSPCADTAIALLTYDAKLVVTELDKERSISLDNFFKGIGGVDLKPTEILTQIIIPKLPDLKGEVFYKLGYRKAMTIAIAGVAVLIAKDEASPHIAKDVRIALSSVAPNPMRAIKAEKLLAGRSLKEDLVEEVANIAASEAAPITDIRATKEYRHQMIPVLVKRALNEAWNNASKISSDFLE